MTQRDFCISVYYFTADKIKIGDVVEQFALSGVLMKSICMQKICCCIWITLLGENAEWNIKVYLGMYPGIRHIVR